MLQFVCVASYLRISEVSLSLSSAHPPPKSHGQQSDVQFVS